MLTSIKLNKYNKSIFIKKINNIFFFFLNFKIFNFNNHLFFLQKYKKYFIYSFIYFFLHIVWRGKAFRLRFFKKKKKFTFNFGHSHWTKLLYKSIYNFVKIKKQLYLIIFQSRYDKEIILKIFNNIRKFNKYTKRGLRVKQHIYYQRFGKVSQANSLLHSFY